MLFRSVLKDKDKLMNEAKENLSPLELSEFTALEKLVNVKIKDGDLMNAMKILSKAKSKAIENNKSNTK